VDCLARGEKDDVRQNGTEDKEEEEEEGEEKGNYGESVREGCLPPCVGARVAAAVSLCRVCERVCGLSRTGSDSCAERFPEAVVHLVSSRLGSACLRPPRSHVSNHVRV